MAKGDYTADRKGLSDLGRSRGMSEAMQAAARNGQAEAERIARSFSRSGRYESSFRVRPETTYGGRNNEARAGAVLENTAAHGTAVEFDSARRNRQGHHVLRRVIPTIEGRR